MYATQPSTSGSAVAHLVVPRTHKMCPQCKPGLDVALIQVRSPAGEVAWSSRPGQEPDRLPLPPGRWQIEYFCAGLLDFDGNQEVSLEPGATYVASCGSPNYQLELRRTSDAPNNSSKRTR